MNRKKISFLLNSEKALEDVLIKGWVRTRRDSKKFSFIEINDGSCLKNIQVIADQSIPDYDQIKKLTIGSAVEIKGKLIQSPGKGQNWELHAQFLNIISISPDDFPLQKKRHTDEYLRTIAHLRPRTNKYGAIFRIRSKLAYAIHKYFNDKGFHYIHTPIITSSDCEGAGDLFRISTLDVSQLQNNDDYSNDFFGKKAYLTVSGQLEAELLALSLGDVYTFGPTFRAENSNTRRHAAEFWMIEPEMAFCDLEENMNTAEDFIKYLIKYILENASQDIDLFNKFVDKNLITTLNSITNNSFEKIVYKDAVKILNESNEKFDYEVSFGNDLQSEHECFLTEKYFKKPVIVYNYPKNIKPFYMRINDDNETVCAMDILVSRIGEIIGGSQREERLDVLLKRMDEIGLDKNDYWWYIDSRKYGTVPHSGFGLGFERLLMLVTGVSNIRDVILFPRTPKNIDF